MAAELPERGRFVALLRDAQREALLAELRGAGAAAAQTSEPLAAEGAGPAGDVSARPAGPWEVYFDNDEFALTQRGWWLREFDGAWLLKLPVIVPAGGGLATVGYEEITDPPEILERAGLAPHAEVLRKGGPRTAQSLLAQAKVVPFARVHTAREVYRLDLGAEGASTLAGADALRSHGASLEVTVDAALFDVKHAENEAVAEMLYERGAEASDALRATVVDFRLLGEGDGARADAQSGLQDFLERRGMRQPAHVQGICPKLAAYLRTWRPLHMRALLKVGAVSEPEQG